NSRPSAKSIRCARRFAVSKNAPKVQNLTKRFVARRWDAALCRSEEHTSELQSLRHLVCRLLLEKKKDEEIHAFQHIHPAPIAITPMFKSYPQPVDPLLDFDGDTAKHTTQRRNLLC